MNAACNFLRGVSSRLPTDNCSSCMSILYYNFFLVRSLVTYLRLYVVISWIIKNQFLRPNSFEHRYKIISGLILFVFSSFSANFFFVFVKQRFANCAIRIESFFLHTSYVHFMFRDCTSSVEWRNEKVSRLPYCGFFKICISKLVQYFFTFTFSGNCWLGWGVRWVF